MATALGSVASCRPRAVAERPSAARAVAAARLLPLPSARAGIRQEARLLLTRAAASLGDIDLNNDEWTKQYVEGEEDAYVESKAQEFKLRFLWLKNNLGVGVDQVFPKGQTSPLTEFYFWPRNDAWEELKAALEAKNYVSERDTVLLLNRTTEVINFWQETPEERPTVERAREMFPDCGFLSS